MNQAGTGIEPRSDSCGLTSTEAAHRLDRFGPNEVPRAAPVRIHTRIAAQLRDPLIMVLLAAAVLTGVTGDFADLAIILLVVVANTTVGVWQEVRADHAIEALAALATPMSRVVRDGVEMELPSSSLVPGDLVLLGEGDVIPADGQLTEAAALRVDESSLTGESVPVDKDPEVDATACAGTLVVNGRGRIVVTHTGALSTLGHIAGLLSGRPPPTPLQRRLTDLSRLLAIVVLVVCSVVMVLGLLRGQDLELMALTAISLAVAAVPESLPAVVTLSLGLAAMRMARRHAVVRRLPAVETLGSVTLLATDKTGTLTVGDMSAERLWTPQVDASADGDLSAGDLTDLLIAAVLCNDATLVDNDTAVGDPTEAALLRVATAAGLDELSVEQLHPRHAEIPFDSRRKRMSTLHQEPDGTWLVVCKGAPEHVLNSHVVASDPVQVSAARAVSHSWAQAGLRVLAFAQSRHDTAPDTADFEQALTLVGLIGILDPPREAAASTIKACRDAGIVPVLVTGDHAATAAAIAARVGIADRADGVVDLTDPAGAKSTPPADERVLARATPEHKLQLIETWQRRGEVVAMTGDGVNDGPALHRADIGVAMGRRGTEVARQAADLVLANDDLETVVAAVEEGRRVYANIRRFLLYGLAGGMAEVLIMLLGPLIGFALPLLPAQILWINLLTHGLVGVALGAEPTDPARMREPPRRPEESVLGAGLWQRITGAAVLLTLISLAAAVVLDAANGDWQTTLFLTLGASQLAVALAARAPRQRPFEDPWLFLAVLGAVVLLAGAVLLGPLATLLDLGTPTLVMTFTSLLGAGLTYVVVRVALRRWAT
jgi:Ca2+-transporting ATPase